MNVSRLIYGVILGSIALAVALPACGSDDDDTGAGTGGTTGTTGGTTGTTGGTTGTTGGTTGTTGGSAGVAGGLVSDLCGDAGCQCSNGIDDDKDGKIDGLDEECTAPYDNDEGTFATGIPGDNRDAKWQDCFFDGNSGAGDDDCRYHTCCLYPGAIEAKECTVEGKVEQFSPPGDCTVSDACVKFCGARAPNGCDCFGCCAVDTDSGTVNVMLGPTCSIEKINDTTACPRCVQSTQCGNTCAKCELCPGKTEADLVAEGCTGSGGAAGAAGAGGAPTVHTCAGGEQVCGSGLPNCASGYYCSLGCCLPSIR